MNTAVPVGLKAGDKFFLQMAPQPVAVQGVGPGFSAPPSAVLSEADEAELRALVRQGLPGTWKGAVTRAKGLFKAWFSVEIKPEAKADHFTTHGATTVVQLHAVRRGWAT